MVDSITRITTIEQLLEFDESSIFFRYENEFYELDLDAMRINSQNDDDDDDEEQQAQQSEPDTSDQEQDAVIGDEEQQAQQSEPDTSDQEQDAVDLDTTVEGED